MLSGLSNAARRAGGAVTGSVKWVGRQARGTCQGFKDLVGDLDKSVPKPVLETWNQLVAALPQAFGIKGGPQDQIVSSVLLAVISIASSVVTAGATLVLVAVFAGTAGVGFLRLIPAVDAMFDSGRSSVRNGGEEAWRRGPGRR